MIEAYCQLCHSASDDKIISNSLVFTSLGEQVIEDAKVIIGMVDNWKITATHSCSEMNIAFSDATGRQQMLDLLFAFQRENPQIKYKLVPNQKRGTHVLEADDGSNFRLGFFIHTPKELIETKKNAKKQGLKIAKLHDSCFSLCLNANNHLVIKDKIYLEDILGCKVVLKQGIQNFPYIEALQRVVCDCSVAPGDHENVMLALMNDPELISFRPALQLSSDYYVSSGLVVIRNIDDCLMEVNQYLIYPEPSRMTVEERNFINFIKFKVPSFQIIN